VRGARRIAEADVVLWAASLVAPECIREHAGADAELIDSSRLTHEQAVEIFRRAERDRLKVARVHSGDPSLWGAVQEQHDACTRMDLEVEIVPGVPAFTAAAAVVGRELTVPEVAQSVILTRLEGGKTPMPEGEQVREFARHGTTMALFLSAARAGQLADELREGGYPEDTPVLVAYKVSWPDELILRTTLAELEPTVKQHKLWRHTLFLVGPFLNAGGTRSRLYHAGHFHTYRRADPQARRALRSEQARSAQERRPGRSDADVAWWAVRDWQESARGSGRGGVARSSASARKPQDDQPDLFVGVSDSSPASEQPVPEKAEEPSLEKPQEAVPEKLQEPLPGKPHESVEKSEVAAESPKRKSPPRTSAASKSGGSKTTASTASKTGKTTSKPRATAKRKRSGGPEQ
jgi:precorrin-4 C11-methyltransferase